MSLSLKIKKPKSSQLFNSFKILQSSLESCESFLNIFNSTRKTKKAGTSTDDEQDLLRAMLLFASSGLDSMIKQAIQDSLESVVLVDEGAQNQFKTYVERELGKGDPKKLLVSAITSDNIKKALVNMMIKDLISSSLQSKEELLRAASYFDIPSNELAKDANEISEIFKIRNQISHEMDIDLKQRNRKRRSRNKNIMIKSTKRLLELGTSFLDIVDKKLYR